MVAVAADSPTDVLKQTEEVISAQIPQSPHSPASQGACSLVSLLTFVQDRPLIGAELRRRKTALQTALELASDLPSYGL